MLKNGLELYASIVRPNNQELLWQISNLFASVRSPSINRVTRALILMLDSEVAGMTELCALIAREPNVAARLLKLADSSQ